MHIGGEKMKKSIFFFMTIVLFCFGITKLSIAKEPKRLAQTTMSFLNVGVGARAVGMGSSFICMDNDASALFWNPAGIAKISGGAISLNHTQWIADISQHAVAATYGNPMLGTFGVSFMLMDNGELERTIPVDISINPEGYIVDGTFTVNQYVAGIAYGRRMTDKFSIGGQIKYAYQDLGSTDIFMKTAVKEDTLRNKKNQKGIFAFDFGTIYYTGFRDLRLAMSFRNFARSVKYAYESYELPLTFKIGIAMNVLTLLGSEKESHSLQVSLDAVHPRDYTERIHIGAEYLFRNLLAIRAGYKFNYDEEDISVGFGLYPGFAGLSLKIDYAYTVFGVFGSIQRFSFGFSF